MYVQKPIQIKFELLCLHINMGNKPETIYLFILRNAVYTKKKNGCRKCWCVMLPIFVQFHANLHKSTETCIMFLLGTDNHQRLESEAALAFCSLHHHHTVEIWKTNLLTFVQEPEQTDISWSGPYSTAGTCEREMERHAESECVWFGPLTVWGDLLSHRDKGNCGVSAYGPAPIASPLKYPTYGTLIDSWQHTQGGLLDCF